MDSLGCSPFTVSFTSLFKDESAKYQWDFGDGGHSALENPKHTYLKPGVYSVKQRIFIKQDSLVGVKEDFIHVYSSVLPNFSTPQSCICGVPPKAAFFNVSKAAENYQWFFSGGEPAEYTGFAPPEIAYNESGSYSVTLVTTNGLNCTDTLTRPDFIRAAGKVAFGTANLIGNCPPFPVMFKDSTKGCISDWEWDFGDGSKHAKVKDPVHIYDKTGEYDVKLTITFKGGCTDSIVKKSFIKIGGVEMKVNANQTTICQSQDVLYQVIANGYVIFEPEKGVLKMIGNTKETDTLSIKYTYRNSGNFLPVFTVMDSSGCIAKIPYKDTILVHPSSRTDFIAEPNFGKMPLKVSLSPKQGQNLEDITRYLWLIEDKTEVISASSESLPSMTIDKTGRWNVRCITENRWGCTDTFAKKEYLEVYEQASSPTEIKAPVVTFTNHPDGGVNIQMSTYQKASFTVNVLDLEGNIILKDTLETEGGTKIYTLSTLTLQVGTYFIEVADRASTWKQSVSFEKK